MSHPNPRDVLEAAEKKTQAVIDAARSNAADKQVGQKARDRAQAFIDKIHSSSLAATEAGKAFEQYIKDLLSKGHGIEALEEELRNKALAALEGQKHIVSFLSDAVKLFARSDIQDCLRTQVVQPARSRQIGSNEAWMRVGDIVSPSAPFPFLTWAESRVGPLTVALGLKAQGGMALGLSGYEGIGGFRYGCACHYLSGSVAVGAIASVEMGVQLSVSKGAPQNATSVTVEVDLGGGYAATGEVAVSFQPVPRTPTLEDPKLFRYVFDGIGVSLGTGGGLDCSMGLTVTQSTILFGTVTGPVPGDPAYSNPPPNTPPNPPPPPPPWRFDRHWRRVNTSLPAIGGHGLTSSNHAAASPATARPAR